MRCSERTPGLTFPLPVHSFLLMKTLGVPLAGLFIPASAAVEHGACLAPHSSPSSGFPKVSGQKATSALVRNLGCSEPAHRSGLVRLAGPVSGMFLSQESLCVTRRWGPGQLC